MSALSEPLLDAVGAALGALGTRNFVLAIHEAAFPGRDGEDVGHGAPGGRGGEDLLAFARALGFRALQLGPQGLTSRGDRSPYNGMLFSRSVLGLDLASLTAEEPWGALLSRRTLERLAAGRPGPAGRVSFDYAWGAVEQGLAEAWAAFRGRAGEARGPVAALVARWREFRRVHAHWLERDGLYRALESRHGGAGWRSWRGRTRAHEDRRLWAAGERAAARRRAALRRHAEAVEAHAFAQILLHEQHELLRRRASALGMRLYGDLQVGISEADVWSHAPLFLRRYVMGAPPSRTNPEGQPWGFAVFDPDRYGRRGEGPVVRFARARLDKVFAEYDSVRIDHPHGLVCPWVYRARAADPVRAVQQGARLFASPDLAEHPELARYAVVRPGQLRREVPRHADEWVGELDEEQVGRLAVLFDVLVEAARDHGRDPQDLACEVLSTQPHTLRRVMERHGLGRFRVTQKVRPLDPFDVYRTERAAPQDWVMAGSHDTPTLRSVAEGWVASGEARDHAGYLAARLVPQPERREAWASRVAADPRALAQAKLAELFVGPARNVSVFFADLFGLRERYNEPGTVHERNWSLRLGPDFAADYAERRARGEALDIPRALATALTARGPAFAASHAGLIAALGGAG